MVSTVYTVVAALFVIGTVTEANVLKEAVERSSYFEYCPPVKLMVSLYEGCNDDDKRVQSFTKLSNGIECNAKTVCVSSYAINSGVCPPLACPSIKRPDNYYCPYLKLYSRYVKIGDKKCDVCEAYRCL